MRLQNMEVENIKLKNRITAMEKFIGSFIFERAKKTDNLVQQKSNEVKALYKDVEKLKQEKLDLINQKKKSERNLKEATEGFNDQKAEFELEKIKLKSEMQQ